MKDFEELLREYGKSAEAYVRYKVSSREDAEDILQETYVRAFSSLDSLNSDESFRPWLISIARNKVNDYYRKKAETEEEIAAEAMQENVMEQQLLQNAIEHGEAMEALAEEQMAAVA